MNRAETLKYLYDNCTDDMNLDGLDENELIVTIGDEGETIVNELYKMGIVRCITNYEGIHVYLSRLGKRYLTELFDLT